MKEIRREGGEKGAERGNREKKRKEAGTVREEEGGTRERERKRWRRKKERRGGRKNDPLFVTGDRWGREAGAKRRDK